MKCIVSHKIAGRGCLLGCLIAFVLFGCVQNEDVIQKNAETITVPIEIVRVIKTTKSIETQPHTVNRVLILPFKKIDESILTQDDSNFSIEQNNVKQVAFVGNPTFSTQVPALGSVSFDHYLLPTFDANSTKLFLDVALGSIKERYPVQVNDVSGVSLNNSISFRPNQVVKISGDYADINLGFTLNYPINLDDADWDGTRSERHRK